MRLIDGDELIELLLSTAITDKQREYSECVQYAVQKMPTVDTVPVRHGRWEMKSDPYGFFDEIPVCSECGCTTRLREVYKFCPNCGADMMKDDGNDS